MITQAELLKVLRSPDGRRRCRELLSGVGQDVTAQVKIDRLMNLLESAWGIICNAGNGNWGTESREWQLAADVFREKYHTLLDNLSPETECVTNDPV